MESTEAIGICSIVAADVGERLFVGQLFRRRDGSMFYRVIWATGREYIFEVPYDPEIDGHV